MGKHGEQDEKERSSTDVKEGEEGGKSEHIAYVYVYICILLEAVGPSNDCTVRLVVVDDCHERRGRRKVVVVPNKSKLDPPLLFLLQLSS